MHGDGISDGYDTVGYVGMHGGPPVVGGVGRGCPSDLGVGLIRVCICACSGGFATAIEVEGPEVARTWGMATVSLLTRDTRISGR